VLRDTRGTLADRVMAAMEAADSKGGDKRCSCGTAVPLVNGKNPLKDIPCDAKTAHVAYILRAEASDANGASFNDGNKRCAERHRPGRDEERECESGSHPQEAV
jgi:hypothetical protein